MGKAKLIWVRGAGELASAVAHLLHRLAYPVILSEIDPPLAIRRTVTFSEAILETSSEVEGVVARFYPTPHRPAFPLDHIPLFLDQESDLFELNPDILIDCRMLKTDQPDMRSVCSLMVGLGPGFHAGRNCHAVIETKRGHDLGRVIHDGPAIPNTGIPGRIGGQASKRLVRAPVAGHVSWQVSFGDLVDQEQIMGTINSHHLVTAPLAGLVRGLISPQTLLTGGMKIGDIDPRGSSVNHLQISDKARTVAYGVLESILVWEKDASL